MECRCCGAPEGERAGITDPDGVYYAVLCADCREEIDAANEARAGTMTPEAMGAKATAAALVELMPDEFADGVVTELEDAGFTVAK